VSFDCPSENDILARVSGALSKERVAVVDAHVDRCPDCRILLAEAVLGLDEPREKLHASRTFAPLDMIANRYVIGQWLGAGGMGEVYEAYDTVLEENVALKTLVPMIADDERSLGRLHAEARMARHVTHENVCRVFDVGFHQRGNERITFFTMELVRGITLRQHLREVGRLDLQAALPLVAQMVAALSHAHAAGIVHRDFKSDNVLLVPATGTAAIRVVVTDFGLARQWLVADGNPVTPQSRNVLGTLDYMAPEQLIGKAATPASDIYSLGIVIYEMLTGQLPFVGDSPLARAVVRVTQSAPRLDEKLPDIDPRATACIARCLETNPERRFGNVDEVLLALRGDASVPRRSPTRRRNGSIAGSAVLGAALVLAVVGHFARRTAPAPSTASSPLPEVPLTQPAQPLTYPLAPSPRVSAVPVDEPPALPQREAKARTARLERGFTKRRASPPPESTPSSLPESAPVIDAVGIRRSTGNSTQPVPSGDALLDPFAETNRAATPGLHLVTAP
jgi:serine/threonine protein kinase